MNPNQNSTPDINLQLESLRQRASLGNSSSGIGADVANSPTVQNPLAQAGQLPPKDGAIGNPSTPTIKGMKQQKGEAQILVDALKQRLQALTKRGE